MSRFPRAARSPGSILLAGPLLAGLAAFPVAPPPALAAPPALAQTPAPAQTPARDAPIARVSPSPTSELDYDGAIATGLALRRLGNTARLLHIGAHPDDENTSLFAPLALGRGADVAYLSLTRGEGGQNGIGPELGTALGLIRSEELLAARRLDGADQFFTRAIDYGYSKNAAEAFRHWPRDSIVADVVAVIRRYRPDVVVSVWSGTPRDGHGQHELSGIVSREAVLAAGDPNRFPEQIEAGLRPFTPRRFFWSARYGDDGPDVELDTGPLDPLLGRSYHQIAMASRSRHRSQDMGQRERPGPRHIGFDAIDPAHPPEVSPRSGVFRGRTVEGAAEDDGSLFADIDTLLSQRAERIVVSLDAAAVRAAQPGSVDPGRRSSRASRDLGRRSTRASVERSVELFREYEALVARARSELDPFAPWEALPLLATADHRLAAAREIIAGLEPAGSESPAGPARPLFRRLDDLRFHMAIEREDLESAMLAVANVKLDAVSDEELVIPGQTFQLRLGVWNGGRSELTALARPLLPRGWSAGLVEVQRATPSTASSSSGSSDAVTVAPNERVVLTYDVTVADDASFTRPYFLGLRAADGKHWTSGTDLYTWPDSYRVRGLPFAPAPVRAEFQLALGTPGPGDGVVTTGRDAAFIGVDRTLGEFRRPVRVVPAVSVTLTPPMTVVPLRQDATASRAGVAAAAGGAGPVSASETGRTAIAAATGADARSIELNALLRSEAPDGIAGEIVPVLPEGWTATPTRVGVTFSDEAEERTIRFEATPPPDLPPGEYTIGAEFRVGDAPGARGGGRGAGSTAAAYDVGYEVIDYPHIAPHHLYRPARARVRALDARVADVRVGYVAGVGDGVPAALDQLGVAWEALDGPDLAEGDLSRFDVIITGARAYEFRPDLVAHNRRLMDWSRAGGTLIVQYNKYPALRDSYAPWPVTIARPHGRVTDETAPVTVLEPDHPIFNTPNEIGPADWEGWVQERGLYFWDTWEGPLRPLLAMHDPGEQPLKGALLVAPLGEGTYVYSALALFRQLPAGVPGAYRLLANLISLGADSGDGP